MELALRPPVSYTHLDVYKRQVLYSIKNMYFELAKITNPARVADEAHENLNH